MQYVVRRNHGPDTSKGHQAFIDERDRVFADETDERLAGEQVEDEEKGEAEAKAESQHQLEEGARLQAEIVASVVVVRFQLEIDLISEKMERENG